MRTISDVYLSDATFFSQLIFGGNIHWTTLIIVTSKGNAALAACTTRQVQNIVPIQEYIIYLGNIKQILLIQEC